MKKIVLLFALFIPYICYSMDVDIQKYAPTPLHRACITGDSQSVKQQLALPHCNINKRGRFNNQQIATPLFLACNYGNHDIVELLLTIKGIKVNKESYCGINNTWHNETPLHVASTKKIARLLIAHGANVNATNGTANQTPLITHTIALRSEIVGALIREGANIRHKDMYGNTALFYALEGQNHCENDAIIKKLLYVGANPIKQSARMIEKGCNISMNLLHQRMPLLNEEPYSFYIFSLLNPRDDNNPIRLLENKGRLLKNLYNKSNNSKDYSKKYDKKALYQALYVIQQLRCATTLTSYIPNFSKKYKRAVCLHKRLFLYQATQGDLITLFGKKTIEYALFLIHLQSFFRDIKKGKVDQILYALNYRKLTLRGTMDNFRWRGKTMIEYAFKHKRSNVIETLFTYYYRSDNVRSSRDREFYSRFDAQLLQPDTDEKCRLALQKGLCNELQYAIFKNNYDEAKRLVDLGINVNEQNLGGNTPLHIATDNEHDDNHLVDLLIAAGADVHRGDKHHNYSRTPLLIAASHDNRKIVHSLLKAGAQINCFPLFSYTHSLLFSPVIGKNIPLIKELIENGVYIHQEYSELAEQGFNDQPYDCAEISAMLQEAYNDPSYPYKNPTCCVCLEYCVTDMPCKNKHKHTFICADCCSSIRTSTNNCPICRTQLIEEKK